MTAFTRALFRESARAVPAFVHNTTGAGFRKRRLPRAPRYFERAGARKVPSESDSGTPARVPELFPRTGSNSGPGRSGDRPVYIHKSNTMNKTTIKQSRLLAALALGLALSASAQTMQDPGATQPAPAAADPGPGLVGTSYSELSFAYQRQTGAPRDLRDYGFTSNGSVFRNDTLGVDANFVYDYLDGHANGLGASRNEAQLGLTGFLREAWGKPFVTADAGMAWQNTGGVSRRGFAYTMTGGVEFQLLRNLALTPFVEYQAEPRLRGQGSPAASLPDHLLVYGVKATCRITRDWSASVGVDLDQHSERDWGLRAGVSYHF